MPDPRRLVRIGECLPKVALPRVGAEGAVSIADGTAACVIVLPHESCPDCGGWLEVLADVAGELRLWGARPVAVVPAGVSAPRSRPETGTPPGPLPYPVVTDVGGALRARIGLAGDAAALVVADRWGAVYEVTCARNDHPAPAGRALVRLAQYIDMQCECGAPGHEWRACTPLPLG